MIRKYLIIIFILLASADGFSAMKNVTGSVTKIQILGRTYDPYTTSGAAITFIHMDALPSACGSTYNRVAITSDHPAYKEVVSAALEAKLSRAQVNMHYVESCTLWNNNAWDFGMFILL